MLFNPGFTKWVNTLFKIIKGTPFSNFMIHCGLWTSFFSHGPSDSLQNCWWGLVWPKGCIQVPRYMFKPYGIITCVHWKYGFNFWRLHGGTPGALGWHVISFLACLSIVYPRNSYPWVYQLDFFGPNPQNASNTLFFFEHLPINFFGANTKCAEKMTTLGWEKSAT